MAKQEKIQETIEEVADRLTKDFPHYSVRGSMDDSDIKGWFLEALQKGYNLSQQQNKNLYSEEDMKRAFNVGFQVGYNDETSPSYLTAEKFIKRFKKKQ